MSYDSFCLPTMPLSNTCEPKSFEAFHAVYCVRFYQGHVVYWIRVPNIGAASKVFVMLISSINFTKACHRKIMSVPFNTINDSAYVWTVRTIHAMFELRVGNINLAHEYILYTFLSITTQVSASHSAMEWKTASVLQEVHLLTWNNF